jgi:tRNA-2-methylthio-N6-dimethylallyladenosine synthase
MAKKLYIETFGCQMNVLDSDLIASRMIGDGYVLEKDRNEADVVLFNTCSVREQAENKALSHAGHMIHLKRRRPGVVIGIVGCMAQNRQKEIFEQLPHVQLVVGPRKMGAIPRLVAEVQETGQRRIAVEETDEEFIDGSEAVHTRATQFQAYIKAMEGCDLSCTYCIVPTTRGKEVSRPPDVIVDEVRRLADQGTVEITLLGQTVNSYGKGMNPRIDLGGLLRRVHEVKGIRRIRFITSHPSFVRTSLVEAMRDLPKVCKYLHIPAQSGSNRILKAMRRGYTHEKYRGIADTLREKVPGIEIASDWIVGFPGETEKDFEESMSLMRDVRFQNSYVFRYSPRPGTDAIPMGDNVPEEVKKERNQALLDLQGEIGREKNILKIGSSQEILVEGPSKRNPLRQTGRTNTHQVVNFEAERDLRGEFVRVRITHATALSFRGELV